MSAAKPLSLSGHQMPRQKSAIYRYRRVHYFDKPPAAIWPFVSDRARLWEFNGMAPYRFEERVDDAGRVRRFVRGKLGPSRRDGKRTLANGTTITASTRCETT